MDDGPDGPDAADGSETPLGRVLPLPPAPDGIELRHLRAFVAVAEELNFGRAAARLYLSQPALSRQIRGLERLVGCDLLRRSTHGVELTLAGDALLDRARSLLYGIDDAVSATRAVGGELAGRLARIWEPVQHLTSADVDLQALRNAGEELHGQFPPPPEIVVRPVNTGGVPSLLLGADPQLQPSLLFLHGGGYVMGSAFGYRGLAGALAMAAEASLVAPEFRLAPEHPFPAALEDAMRAYLWMLDTGTPPDQITMAGDSAGCGLVLSLMVTLQQEKLPLPGGAALLCPGIDLTFDHVDEVPSIGTSEPQPALSLEQLRSFAVSYLDGHPADDPVISPLNADLTGMPPLLIQGGTGDVLVVDAHRLADHAKSHGVDTRLELYPVATHDFHIFWSFLPEAAEALQQAGRFAQEVRAAATTAAREAK
ncbi:MAG TPA: alpha/beta hydrolase fold domain-containing protein [Acidimicrobiales bacterium]|nr:alpha/beta hydrolase fold domain-containing protein [Acidimicrobiales bacterium]